MNALRCLALLALVVCASVQAAARPLRIGALAYGTLHWELTVIAREGLDRRFGVALEQRSLANPQAGTIALQSGAVDLIVGSWLWAARQRGLGQDFTAVPYSLAHSALIAPPDSPIRALSDLRGKRLGIAGGPLYEDWILLKALAKRQGVDLEKQTEPIFAAPPLLNEQLRLGRLDAVLNFWHYAAHLEAEGYRRLLDGDQLLKDLKIQPPVPVLAYLFRQRWAESNSKALIAFLRAAYSAKDAICTDPRVWTYVAPLTGSDDPKVQLKLRQRYCEGRLRRWGEEEIQAARQLYRLLAAGGGEPLTGPAPELPAGTFWPGFAVPR
ncbi:ABC transporter substrate-binding protein [Methylothermus subterraneus]